MHLTFELGKTPKLEDGSVTFVMENKEVRNVKLGEVYDINEDSEEEESSEVPPTESSIEEEVPATQVKKEL